MANKYNEPEQVKCAKCGAEFQISRSGYNAIKRVGSDFKCKACLSKERSERNRIRMACMSEEDK